MRVLDVSKLKVSSQVLAANRKPRPRRILYVQFTDPAGYPPLEHSSRILADRGWEVLFLGTGSSSNHGLRFPPHDRITIKTLKFVAPGIAQKIQYLRFCIWVLIQYVLWRPQWVYASDALACPVAWLLQTVARARIIYHEHDSPTDGGWES